MTLEKIISIQAKSGLFRILANNKSGLIVESLIDKKRTVVSTIHKATPITEIVVFTEEGEIRLVEVLRNIYKHTGGTLAIDHKSSEVEIREFFEKVLPNYDRNRVHFSDMKKIIFWYNLIYLNDLIKLISDNNDETTNPPNNTVDDNN